MDEDYWERHRPDADEVIPEDEDHRVARIEGSEKQRVRFNMVRELYQSIPYNDRPVKQYTSRGSYKELRRDLVLSFKQQYGVGLICTPRGKQLTKNLLLVLDRTELESY